MFKGVIANAIAKAISQFLQAWLIAKHRFQAGISKQREAQLEQDLEDVRKASDAERNVDTGADSMLNDPDNVYADDSRDEGSAVHSVQNPKVSVDK